MSAVLRRRDSNRWLWHSVVIVYMCFELDCGDFLAKPRKRWLLRYQVTVHSMHLGASPRTLIPILTPPAFHPHQVKRFGGTVSLNPPNRPWQRSGLGYRLYARSLCAYVLCDP